MALFVLVVPLLAQVSTADIVGTVIDSSGAVLVDSKVTAENPATNLTRTVATDSSGNYTFILLPAGRYNIKVEKTGFRTANINAVVLAIGDRSRQDVRLEVGQAAESVEVSAQATALQSDSSSLGTLVNERAVQDLPLNGRNFVRLATLGAGANEGTTNGLATGNRPDDRRRNSSFQVNGQSDNRNNFLIDGMDNNERFIGTIIVRPSIDALAEFKVQTNLYSAEIGRTAGGVINAVTKSGTNNFHGSAFEFFRNEKLDAKNFFAPQGPTPKFRQNQLGGSIGGPIRKNKTFFFTDYEGFWLRQGLTFVSTVPTVAMRQGNFAGVNPIFDPLSNRLDPRNPSVTLRDRFPNDVIPATRIDQVALNVLNLYPIPTSSGLANNFVHAPTKSQTENTFDFKIDEQFTTKDVFFARYSLNDTNTYLPAQLPKKGDIIAGGDNNQFSGGSEQRSQGLHLNYVHIFRPNLLAELKAGYSRFAISTLPVNYGVNASQMVGILGSNADLDSSGLTPMVVAGFRGLGDSNFIPIIIINNVFQYAGSLSYTRSSHTVKVGGDFRRRQTSPFQSPQSRGQFTFNGNFTNDPSGAVANGGNSIASMLLGYPSNTVRAKYLVFPGFRNSEISGYAQDDWRIGRWLTLNLGVRYDVYTPQYEVHDRISNADLDSGRLIIAGQNGVSRSAGMPGDWNNFAPRFGFAATVTPRTIIRGGFGLNYYPVSFGSGAALRNPPFVNLFTIDATPITPINRISAGFPAPTPTSVSNPTGNLTTVARDIVNPYVMQYNLTLQRELISGLVFNIGYVGALSRKQNFSPNINIALPGAGSIGPRRPYFSKFPNVASISQLSSWGSSNYHSLQTSLEHRFKSGLNLSSNYTWSHLVDDFANGSGKVGGFGATPQLVNNRSLERGNSDIDIRHRFVVLVNYELPFAKNSKGVARYLANGWQINAIGTLQSGPNFTVQNGAARANTGGSDRPNYLRDATLSSDQRTLNRWFDTSAFVAQPLNTIGNAPRNPLYGPGRQNLDFSLLKNFQFKENLRLQFRAEAFNITNTPNFEVPGNNFGTSSFGVISGTANTLPRNLQFALKLLF